MCPSREIVLPYLHNPSPLVETYLTGESEYRVVCYYTNWAQYRLDKGDRLGYPFVPEDIPPELCTHIIFSFAHLNEEGTLDKSEWNDLDQQRGALGM